MKINDSIMGGGEVEKLQFWGGDGLGYSCFGKEISPSLSLIYNRRSYRFDLLFYCAPEDISLVDPTRQHDESKKGKLVALKIVEKSF